MNLSLWYSVCIQPVPNQKIVIDFRTGTVFTSKFPEAEKSPHTNKKTPPCTPRVFHNVVQERPDEAFIKLLKLEGIPFKRKNSSRVCRRDTRDAIHKFVLSCDS